MAQHIVIDGNAFYEVDEECLQRREQQKQKRSGAPVQRPEDRRKTAEEKSTQNN